MLIQKQRRGWEYIVIALTVASAMWMTIALYSKRDQVFKERLLALELMQLRNEVTAVMLEQRKRPVDLGQRTMDNGPWTKNKEGILLDPFGNAYHYNPKTGTVYSTTAPYRSW